MLAVILAAGMGNRLGALTADLPKPLVNVSGQTLLQRNIHALRHVRSISRIIIVTGYKQQRIVDHIHRSGDHEDLALVHNPRFEAGSILSIAVAEEYLEESFVILNADHVFSTEAYEAFVTTAEGIAIGAYYHRLPGNDEMKVFVNDDGSLAMSKTLPQFHCGYPGLTFVGKDYVSDYFGMIRVTLQSNGIDSPVESVIPRISRVTRVKLCDMSGYEYFEVDTPEDYARAGKHFDSL